MSINYTEIQTTKNELIKCQKMISELLSNDIFNDCADDCVDEQCKKIVVYSTTSNTYDLLRASLKSLFYNADIDQVFLISDVDVLPKDFPKEIQLITFNEPPKYFMKNGENIDTKYTYFCLLRTAFHRIFENANKILSLDYDTIIRKNISDLWDVNMGSKYYVAGAMEPRRARLSLYGYNPNTGFIAQSEPVFKTVDYINSGVMLMNLQRLRDDGVGDKMIDMINNVKLSFPEQDAINAICHRHIYPLKPEYNAMNFVAPCEDPKIIHFAGPEKKMDNIEVRKYANLSWENVKKRRNEVFGKDITI